MDAPKSPSNIVVVEESALQAFLYKLTKKCSVRCPHNKKMQLVEEEAILFCHLLIKEGLFDIIDCNGCTVCAVANLEKRIMRQMKQQMEVVKKARNYYSQPENAKFYKLCSKHRPVHPSWFNTDFVVNSQPPAQTQSKPQPHFVPPAAPQPVPLHAYYAEPYKCVMQYPIPVPPPPFMYFPEPAVAYVPVVHSVVGPPLDSFIPIPFGIDPVYFMRNYYEWVKHLQQPIVPSQRKRMPYTNSFPLEPVEEVKSGEKR